MSELPQVLFASGRRTPPLSIPMTDLLGQIPNSKVNINCIGTYNPKGESLEQTTQDLLGHNVSGITTFGNAIRYNSPYPCCMFDASDFVDNLNIVLDTNPTDLVLTQLNNSHNVIDAASRRGIKVIHWVHDNDPLNALSIQRAQEGSVSMVLFNSLNTKQNWEQGLRCPSSVLHPPISPERCLAQEHDPRYITMINPLLHKGGEILRGLVQLFPNEKFLIIEPFKGPIDFSGFSNVRLLGAQADIRPVYAASKLHLIPSQWEEAFGMVAVEAQLNGIPVIASNNGGLKESVGDGGILIDEFTELDAWQIALDMMLKDEVKRKKVVEAGYINAQKFDIDIIAEQFSKIIFDHL
jgi:hypothetical protein